MPNRNWSFVQQSLTRELRLQRLIVVNDFAAVAWGLPDLTAADLQQVGAGEPVTEPRWRPSAPGPVWGLPPRRPAPASGLWWKAKGATSPSRVRPRCSWRSPSTSGGKQGHCSAENLLSGPGLVNIHMALAALQGRSISRPDPAQVSEAAATGDALAGEARAVSSVLGSVAGNLALTVGARGGVFIAGGIVPRLLEPLMKSRFRACFEDKGRHRYYLEPIPTYVITEPYPAFAGWPGCWATDKRGNQVARTGWRASCPAVSSCAAGSRALLSAAQGDGKRAPDRRKRHRCSRHQGDRSQGAQRTLNAGSGNVAATIQEYVDERLRLVLLRGRTTLNSVSRAGREMA